HYEFHTDQLKSPEIKTWTPEQRQELVRHLILHARFINPQNALMLAQQFGFADLVQQIMPMVTGAPSAPAGPGTTPPHVAGPGPAGPHGPASPPPSGAHPPVPPPAHVGAPAPPGPPTGPAAAPPHPPVAAA